MTRIRLLGALLLGALLCPFPAAATKAPPAITKPAPAMTLQALLARHREAAASPAARHRPPQALETVYKIEAAGMSGTLTEYDAPPRKSRVEIALGQMHQVIADDGVAGWEQDFTGLVRRVTGAELAEQRAQQTFSLENYDPKRDAPLVKVVLRPKREPVTGDYIVDVFPKGGGQQTLYVDPKTFLVRRMKARVAGLIEQVRIQEYSTVDGEKVPSRLQMTLPGLPILVSATLVSARHGLPLAAELFSPPAATRDFEFLTPGGVGPATVPFRAIGNQVIIQARVNDKTLNLLLDSGAGNSFLTAHAAQAAGITLAPYSPPALGYGGAARTNVAVQTPLEILGGVRFRGLRLFVLQDSPVTRELAARGGIDGAIGYDALARLTARIDYAHATVTFSDPKTAPAPAPGATVLPITLEKTRTPTILASVDGRPLARFLVDTGDSGAVHLFTPYAKENGLLATAETRGAQVLRGYGVGGFMQEVITRGHRLTLGGDLLTDVPVATASNDSFTQGGLSAVDVHAGGIGNMALEKYVVTFDYARNRMILEKPSGWTPVVGPMRFPGAPAAPAQTGGRPTRRSRFWAHRAAPAPPLTTAGVLRRHLAAMGGRAAVASIRNTRVTAAVRTGGITGTITSVYEAPDKEYEDDRLGLQQFTQGYDGQHGWRADANGSVRPLGGDELRMLRNQLFLDTASYALPGRMRGTVHLRPRPEAKTGDLVLDVLPDGGKPAMLYLDPRTFLIVKEAHDEDNVRVTTTFGGYKPFDGVMTPTVQRITNGTAKYDVLLTATKVENNVSLPEALFSPPATASRKFAFVTPGQTAATVPFEEDQGEIALSVRINGTPERVFLDTGASGIALSQQTARALHLKQGGFLEARGYGGSQNLYPVQLDSLEVPGAIRVTQVTAMAIPLPGALSDALRRPLAGFVGYDLLAHYVVRLDYVKHQITFLDPDAFQPSAKDGTALPLELDSNIPSVVAQLDDLPPARFLLDTGDAHTGVRLYTPYVQLHQLMRKYPGGVDVHGSGIGGLSPARLTRVDRFSVAGVSLRDVPASFSLDPKGGSSSLDAGAIGSGLLSRFLVTFDYPHGRVFFAPTPDTQSAFEGGGPGRAARAAAGSAR